MLHRLFVSSMLAALVCSSARADFVVDIQGVAYTGSNFTPTGSSAIPLVGQSFDVQASVSTPPFYSIGPSQALYTTSSVTARVGSAIYTLTNPSTGVVNLVNISNPAYEIGISADFQTNYFLPIYNIATPNLNPLSPVATVFSGYGGDAYNATLVLATSTGTLTLTYDASVGPISAAINPVPEPSSLVYFVEATVLGLGVFVYRSRRKAAVAV